MAHSPIIQFTARPGILDLGWGHPRPALLPVREWAAASASLGWEALTYGHSSGPGPLLDWLAAHVGSPVPTFFVTGGASHGLALITQLLTSPGDVVLVDSPTYHLAFRILADHRVRLRRAPATAEELDALLRSGLRPSLLYLVPTFGNPTGESLPLSRRRALLDVAARHGLTVVEDDTYRELVYAGSAPASLWDLAGGSSTVVRLGSFAKTVAPGLRLGWINAAPAVIARLCALGYVDSGGGVNHATAMTMATFGTSGAYHAHVSAVRDHYRTQRDALVSALRTHLPDLTVPSPDGGWFIWLPLPPGVTATALLPHAEAAGTSFVPGNRFYVDGVDGLDRIRLSFSHLSPDELTEAAARLAAAVQAPKRR